ncbi:calcium-binding protein [Phaeobacter sp. 22II1-1F12B]|uniref:calcium-binding protein n=1 Tax=Phaeobacter sp. 22II1-1F12B TaxID=1317111 RepID=UPI000B52155A|nr:calcium-binding protein [Phaeobacter sp. 22II1-1F12B]
MAIVTFFPVGSGNSTYYNLLDALRVDGAVSADATTIVGVTTLYAYQFYDPYYPYPPYGGDEIADVTIEGSFTYGDLATVSGTISSITVSVDGEDLMEITGIIGDASRIWALLNGGSGYQVEVFSGNDTFNGTDESDYFQGYDGRDKLFGMAGYDSLYGGDNNDRIRGGDGGDYLYGGKGSDRMFGNAGRDNLYGGGGDDHMSGGAGRDWIVGGRGDNIMDGGAKNDTLISGNASNTLTGGSGNDTFIFKKFGEDDLTIAHTIMDFEEGDTLLFTEFRRNMELEFTQDGNDVVITYNNNMVTVLDAVLAEVESAVDTVRYDYYY